MEHSSETSPQARAAVLDTEVAGWIRKGWRVESKSDFQAVMVTGRPVNHLLHLIISLLTSGLWLIVWLILTLTGGEDRELVQVDAYGNITSEEVRVSR